jgi:hypothetical protein
MSDKNWLSHVEWAVMFVTLIGGFYAMDARIDASNARFDQFLMAWHEESRDFHARLCVNEERNRKN